MKRYLSLLIGFFYAFCAFGSDPHKPKPKKPKNIILMIGDGTGLAQLFAAYAANGFYLNIFSLAEVIGLSNTSSSDDFITDSAAGATAFSTGKKTKNGMLGMGPDSVAIETITETAEKKGKSTGVVVTCELPHATPAAFFAHQPNRNMYPQIVKDLYKSNMNILVGGGFPYFDTVMLKKSNYNVALGIHEMQKNHAKKQVCFYNTDSFPAKYSAGRGDVLEAGSMHAIHELSKNKSGFFLMIEGSQIDWGGHDNDSAYVVDEALDFDRTAKKAIEWAKADGNTLVIITADHECGGLTLTGYDSAHKRPQMNFSTGHHTAIMVPVFAYGPGASVFGGVYENTEIYEKMRNLMLK